MDAQAAAAALRRGGIVAYPTEGVFGLGCDPANDQAVERLIALKQRDPQRGFILIAAALEQLEPYLLPLAPPLLQRVSAGWPGPVTWILRCVETTPSVLRGNRDTIAVRVTAHPVASALCTASGHPLISTSANLSGSAPCLTAADVRSVFSSGIDCIIDAPVGDLGGPTPIFDGQTGRQLR